MGAGKSRTSSNISGINNKFGDEQSNNFPEKDIIKTLALELGYVDPDDKVQVGWDSVNDKPILDVYIPTFVENNIVSYVYNTFGKEYVLKVFDELYNKAVQREDYDERYKNLLSGNKDYSYKQIYMALNKWSSGSIGSYGSTEIRHASLQGIDKDDGLSIKNNLYNDILENTINTRGSFNSTELYRGIRVKDSNFIKNLSVGDKIDLRGISSWSASKSIAEKFTNYEGEKVVFVIPKNKTKSFNIQEYSSFSKEVESIVSSNFKPTVTNISEDSGITYVTLK